MSRGYCKFILAVLLAAALATGCDKPGEPMTLDVAGVAPAVDYAELAKVLGESVSASDGRVDVEAFEEAKLSDTLDEQLRRLAVTGPRATPELFTSPEARLAYWCNARAAWAIKLAELEGWPEEAAPVRLMERQFPLDGRMMTLAEIDTILATDEDWRTVVAAPGVLLNRAPLPTTPFGAADIRERIAGRFNAFIDNADRFVIDIAHKRIRVPNVLYGKRHELIAAHNARYATRGATLTTALLPYTNGSAHRRLQDAMGYPCVRRRTSELAVTRPDDP